jgi:hypothetical protein
MKNIFITGPDGVGKSTLIDFFKINNKYMVNMLNIEFKHANRFVQNEYVVKNNYIEYFVLCKFFGCLIKKKLLLLKSKLLSKSVVIIFDRSFFDYYLIHYKNNFIKSLFIWMSIDKKNTLLLIDSSERIYYRKQELTIEQIDNYYSSLINYSEELDIINIEDLGSTKYKINSIIVHKILTRG